LQQVGVTLAWVQAESRREAVSETDDRRDRVGRARGTGRGRYNRRM